MSFKLPKYRHPDFDEPKLKNAPDCKLAECDQDGVVPDDYHATSIFPEYFKVNGEWKLAEESRMDCVVVLRDNGWLDAVEMRSVKKGDKIFLGRTERGEEGVYLHATGFDEEKGEQEQFAFRGGRSRETAYSKDYDNLYELLKHEKEYGNIVWTMGPAFAFDHDSRRAMQSIIEAGYMQGLLAGNALATHDLEAGFLRTALGQDIYTQKSQHNGHYNHIDVLNLARRSGSIAKFIDEHNINDGIMYACEKQSVPYVMTGSIRDDGPLPGVIGDAYAGQDAMRKLIRPATTIICLATQLHTIATGNMTPSFRVIDGEVRPLYIYSIDISEFAVNKLSDRGSLSAISMVTNAQDFIVNVAKGLEVY